jgi:cellulose synthase/poly-beta-1,6-N-acetylglucosamine synthase-like glycosyltransferase
MTVLEIIAAAVFWLCMAAMFHTYILYPLTLRFWPKRFAVPPTMPDDRWPTVAVLIPAYNEEAVIEAKVRNSLSLDYPDGKLTVLVGSDGSTDRTDQIVEAVSSPRLQLIRLPGRSGKTGVLNQLSARTDAGILVFTDANVMLAPDALRKLIRHFADPAVGVAGGGKYIQIPQGAEAVRGEAIYGAYENRLRAAESAIGGMSGVMGSCMAMRHALFQPFAPGAINDDTVPSIWAVLAGQRNVYDIEAKAFEESGRSVAEEFNRRIRIGAGNFQTLFHYIRVLSPAYGVAAYTYFCHKVLRWIFPFLMLGALVGNLLLVAQPVYSALLLIQLAGYAAVLAGFLLDRIGIRIPLINQLYHFTALNVALLRGFFVYARGIRTSAWQPTERDQHS